MSQTRMQAGRAVAAYIDNGLGRRIVISRDESGCYGSTILLAMTQAEAWEAISVLRQLVKELPP